MATLVAVPTVPTGTVRVTPSQDGEQRLAGPDQIIKCTPGHWHDCQAATVPICTCACAGANHSILLTHPLAQIYVPKNQLITVCALCGRPAGYSSPVNEWQHKDNPWADANHHVQPYRIDRVEL